MKLTLTLERARVAHATVERDTLGLPPRAAGEHQTLDDRECI